MTRKRIKEGLSRAVTAQTPDRLNEILQACDMQKGDEAAMQAQIYENAAMPIKQNTKTRKRVWPRLAAVAAAVLAIGLVAPFGYGQLTVDSVIGIDVNPSLELRTNASERVLSVTALNDDARIVLGGMDLKNVDLDVAVNALVGSMLKHGYVNEIKNSILLTVENADTQKGMALQTRLSEEINGFLNANALQGAVISQNLAEDARIRALAEAHGISFGRAALVDLLVSQDERLQFTDVAQLGVSEINLLIASRQVEPQGLKVSGQLSGGAYIGEEQAKALALTRAGVLAPEAMGLRVKLDFDDGRMVYEINFYTADAEYECELDATTGDVVSFDKDTFNNTASSGAQPAPSPTAASVTITEAKAKQIALAHAQLAENAVTFIKVKNDRENGRKVFDVEFYSGSIEYDYEIDAITGNILSFDFEVENHFIPTPRPTIAPTPATTIAPTIAPTLAPTAAPTVAPTAPPANAQADSYIGEARAKEIALTHAKLTEAEVSHMKVRLDRDDGYMVYEVEFHRGHMEYEYDIDAINGAILEWDHDYDD